MNENDLRLFLDEKADLYNQKEFVLEDTIQIPHLFTLQQDIEISGFLTASIAWGNRKSIIKSAHKMLDFMGNAPYDFILNYSEKELRLLENQNIHRTFMGSDFVYFIKRLRTVYRHDESMESLFLPLENEPNMYHAIERFRSVFISNVRNRAEKHISSPYKNAAAKRLIMFLRWMVRSDNRGVDFGIWQNIPSHKLSVPLDVHSGNIARKLGIITRKQNDWKTVEEMDGCLRKLDPKDPAKYDFALFGLGVNKDW